MGHDGAHRHLERSVLARLAVKREAEEDWGQRNVTMPPFPSDDFAIQALLPAARYAQLIP